MTKNAGEINLLQAFFLHIHNTILSYLLYIFLLVFCIVRTISFYKTSCDELKDLFHL